MNYYLDVADDLLQRLRDLHAEAERAGQLDAFAEGARWIYKRLQTIPHATGEIKYLTRLGDPVHLVVSGPLAMNYVIHEQPPVVWVIKADRLLARDG